MADRQGQVAHTRGSGETVATSPSDEEQMAIIFRCSILGDSLLALKRRRNPVRLDFIDLYLDGAPNRFQNSMRPVLDLY